MAKNVLPFSPAANGLIADVIKQIEKEQRVKFTPGKVEKITKALVPTLTKLGPEYLETHKNELTKGLVTFLKDGRTYASRIGSEYAISTKELENIATKLEKQHQPQANAAKLVKPPVLKEKASKASSIKEQTPPLTPEELQLVKIDLLRKEALAKELAKIKTDSPIQQKTKNSVEDNLRDKGKAAVDLLGERIGKSGGALLQSALFIMIPNASYGQFAPLFLFVSICFWFIWLIAIKSLNKKYLDYARKI